MAWRPRSQHISQLFHHSGDASGVVEGANDCFEACLARYLRETKWPFAGNDDELVAKVRLLTTGQPDHAGQGFTSLEQGGRALTTLGIPWHWSNDFSAIRKAPWAILWVRPEQLRTVVPNRVSGQRLFTDYPLAWLGTDTIPDHFILHMPNGWCNDPLSFWNGEQDTRYTMTSLAVAVAGAYLLDGVPYRALRGTRRPAPDDHIYVVSSPNGLHLREAPTLTAPILKTLSKGVEVHDVYDSACLWVFAEVEGHHGWLHRDGVKRL